MIWWRSISLPASGARKDCYQKFTSRKDLPKFVSEFWSLDKRDQDTLVPNQRFVEHHYAKHSLLCLISIDI